eukprot:4715777-Karenia_brevis.AAC.1
MQGYAYYFRILAICYNVMQDIPKSECTNWVALCREYMRKHYHIWRKERITLLKNDARAIHWTSHVDRASPASGARYNTHVADE